MILIVGGRYGSLASEQKEKYEKQYISITRKEYETARQKGIPIMVFVEQNVFAEYKTYMANQKKMPDGFKYAFVDDARIFEFISNLEQGAIKIFSKIDDIEHYFSHIWDMRGLEYGLKTELHGIQCAVGTVHALELYDRIKKIVPDRQKALEYVRDFDFESWSKELEAFLGNGSKTMIAQEKNEQKYNKQKHSLRIEKIAENWNNILEIISKELPDTDKIKHMLIELSMPVCAEDIGISKDILPMTFIAAKDIRDKYVLPRLAWDLGIIEELADTLK
jgi:hypothetical protein